MTSGADRTGGLLVGLTLAVLAAFMIGLSLQRLPVMALRHVLFAAGVDCLALQPDGQAPTGRKVSIRARHTVLAGGGINTPGLLLRSRAPDPHRRVGKRTFLHVVPGVFAQFGEDINPFWGAPQSVYSDHFQWEQVADGPIGFKLEVMPMHPGLSAALMGTHGRQHLADMQALPRTNAMLALLRDGFHDDSPGGSVELRDDGAPVLDYPVNDYILEGARRAHHAIKIGRAHV